jgi:hypothetical protein
MAARPITHRRERRKYRNAWKTAAWLMAWESGGERPIMVEKKAAPHGGEVFTDF